MTTNTSSAATTAVLNINELLSIIFEELHIRDLARCLCVCRHWRAIINSSIVMHRSLFLLQALPTVYLTCRGKYQTEVFMLSSPASNGGGIPEVRK